MLAVEIKQFRGASHTTLVPQVIGRTVAKLAVRPRSSRLRTLDEFYDRFVDSSVARRLITAAEQAGAEIYLGVQGVSIRIACSFHTSPVSVAWLYPSAQTWGGTKGFTFGTTNWVIFPPEAQSTVDEMHSWFESQTFTEKIGGTSQNSITGWAVDPAVAAQHVDVLAEQLATTISRLRQC